MIEPIKVSDEQLEIFHRLLPYEGRSALLGGPGLGTKEAQRMLGEKGFRKLKALQRKGLVERSTGGRWRVAPWLSRILTWQKRSV